MAESKEKKKQPTLQERVQQLLRAMTSGVGRVERIHNAYIKPRVKLAD